MAQRVQVEPDCSVEVTPERECIPHLSNALRQQLLEVAYQALSHVVRLLAAVACCMAFVTAWIVFTPSGVKHTGLSMLYTPQQESHDNAAQRAKNSILNAFMLIAVVAVMTCVLVSMFYYRFYRLIRALTMAAVSLLLSGSSSAIMTALLTLINVPSDIFTTYVISWNFVVTGLASVFGRGPLILQQGCLIIECAFAAISVIKLVPDWTMWWLLALIPLWNIIAVVSTFGPLRFLVEIMEERGEAIQPGLVFSTGAPTWSVRGWLRQVLAPKVVREVQPLNVLDAEVCGRIAGKDFGKYEGPGPSQHTRIAPRRTKTEKDADEHLWVAVPNIEDHGAQIGLSDFVFYSILIGKATTYWNWNLIAACFLAILVGICLTLLLLAVADSEVPALPISLVLGLMCVGLNTVTEGFTNELLEQQVFI